MTADDTIENRILELSREEALEAGQAFASLLEEEAEPSRVADDFTDEVAARPLKYLDDVDNLARVLLLAAAHDPELRDRVIAVVGAVGRTAFIFGGAEIVALAGLAVVALHAVLSRGRKSETTESTFEVDDQGRITKLKIRNHVEYGLTPGVAKIVTGAQQQPYDLVRDS